MDKVDKTPARSLTEVSWDVEAKARLDELVEAQPVLIRISAAKRLRDAAERTARQRGANIVTPDCLEEALLEGATA
jgi:chlorophyllide a reductase subunit Z